MSRYVFDIVKHAVDVYLDALHTTRQEDIIMSRPPTEFAPTPRATKINHDGAMINKVFLLKDDHAMLDAITRILNNLPTAQYRAIIAKYYLVGLAPPAVSEKQRAYEDQDRANYLGQTLDQYKSCLKRARNQVLIQINEWGEKVKERA